MRNNRCKCDTTRIMEIDIENYDKETVHDFLTDKKVLLAVAAQGKYPSVLYHIYIGAVIAIHFYLIAMALITICIVSETKMTSIDACHIFLLVSFSAHGLINRHAIDGTLRKTIYIIKSGVYLYKNEDVDEEHLEIKRNHVATIRKTSKFFNILMYIAAVCNAILIPIIQAMLFKGNASKSYLNPYLPKPFYMPFDTWSVFGFAVGYFFNLCFFFYLILSVACMNEIYLSCTLQLKAQIQILNHSLIHIDKRAYLIYKKVYGTLHINEWTPDLFKNNCYQECLYQCLRSNVQHHQAILRLRKTFHKYTGACVLDNIAIASLILASNLFLVMEEPRFFDFIILVITLIAEMLYSFQCCYGGELVMEQSNELFFSLYKTPWIYCDVRFNRILRIIMTYTKKPIKISAIGFDFSASLETYGEIISGMYKFMNLARQDSSSLSSQ